MTMPPKDSDFWNFFPSGMTQLEQSLMRKRIAEVTHNDGNYQVLFETIKDPSKAQEGLTSSLLGDLTKLGLNMANIEDNRRGVMLPDSLGFVPEKSMLAILKGDTTSLIGEADLMFYDQYSGKMLRTIHRDAEGKWTNITSQKAASTHKDEHKLRPDELMPIFQMRIEQIKKDNPSFSKDEESKMVSISLAAQHFLQEFDYKHLDSVEDESVQHIFQLYGIEQGPYAKYSAARMEVKDLINSFVFDASVCNRYNKKGEVIRKLSDSELMDVSHFAQDEDYGANSKPTFSTPEEKGALNDHVTSAPQPEDFLPISRIMRRALLEGRAYNSVLEKVDSFLREVQTVHQDFYAKPSCYEVVKLEGAYQDLESQGIIDKQGNILKPKEFAATSLLDEVTCCPPGLTPVVLQKTNTFKSLTKENRSITLSVWTRTEGAKGIPQTTQSIEPLEAKKPVNLKATVEKIDSQSEKKIPSNPDWDKHKLTPDELMPIFRARIQEFQTDHPDLKNDQDLVRVCLVAQQYLLDSGYQEPNGDMIEKVMQRHGVAGSLSLEDEAYFLSSCFLEDFRDGIIDENGKMVQACDHLPAILNPPHKRKYIRLTCGLAWNKKLVADFYSRAMKVNSPKNKGDVKSRPEPEIGPR